MSAETPFRAIEPFLSHLMESRALATVLEMGMIPLLAERPMAHEALIERFGFTPRGLDLLTMLLTRSGVLMRDGEQLGLTTQFRQALTWRDLIECKLKFADIVLPDVFSLFGPLLQQGSGFAAEAQVFELFRYDRAMQRSMENRLATQRWVQITTTLTKYEAPGLIEAIDFTRCRQILDVGGNSGEMARQIAIAAPEAELTVFDLPVVCDVGRQHLAGTTEARRVRFLEGDARNDPLPVELDMVIFKSMLHDWPEPDALGFLRTATAALKPGGRLVIFERAPFAFSAEREIPYLEYSNLVFFQFLRDPAFYRAALKYLGFEVRQNRAIRLDMPFTLIEAVRQS
jgi:SAM-dependent methyltransferase